MIGRLSSPQSTFGVRYCGRGGKFGVPVQLIFLYSLFFLWFLFRLCGCCPFLHLYFHRGFYLLGLDLHGWLYGDAEVSFPEGIVQHCQQDGEGCDREEAETDRQSGGKLSLYAFVGETAVADGIAGGDAAVLAVAALVPHAFPIIDYRGIYIAFQRQKISPEASPSLNRKMLSIVVYFGSELASLIFLSCNDMQGLLIALCLLLATAAGKLYQVVAVIAPGARYHINDLYDGWETQSQWGEITPVGLRQHENLGKLFRKEYIEKTPLLANNFNKNELEVICLTLNRSIESGLSNLYGLYPLGQGQKLVSVDHKYHIPPYAYNNDSSEQVYALPQGQLIHFVRYDSNFIEKCPNQQAEIEKNIRQQLTEYNEMVLTYTPFLKKTATAFGMDSASMNFTKLAALYDTVNVDKYLGKSLPSGFKEEDFANLQHLASWYSHFTRSFNLSHAYSTHTLSRVLQNFDNRVKTPEGVNLKWSTLSVDAAHLVALQNDLNISSALCIEEVYRKGSTQALNCQLQSGFASSLVFELHSDNAKDFYVRVRDNGKYMNLCDAKQTSCTYAEWKSRAQRILVPNVQAICGKPQLMDIVTQ